MTRLVAPRFRSCRTEGASPPLAGPLMSSSRAERRLLAAGHGSPPGPWPPLLDRWSLSRPNPTQMIGHAKTLWGTAPIPRVVEQVLSGPTRHARPGRYNDDLPDSRCLRDEPLSPGVAEHGPISSRPANVSGR